MCIDSILEECNDSVHDLEEGEEEEAGENARRERQAENLPSVYLFQQTSLGDIYGQEMCVLPTQAISF